MNDRWITLGGALLALVFATGLLFPRFNPAPPPASRPTSEDAGEAGMLGLYRWLEGSAVAVRRLHTRYDTLAGIAPAAGGNLLVASQPMRYAPRLPESQALAHWLERGNSLLLLRADAAVPDWAMGKPGDDLLLQLGIATEKVSAKRASICRLAQPEKSADVDAPKQAEIPREGLMRLLPSPGDTGYPLLRGVRSLEMRPSAEARARGAPQEYSYNDEAERFPYDWMCDVVRQRNALWQFRRGNGTIWIAGYADLFANANLGRADNARLLSNMLQLAVGPGGAVIFDDMHQGNSALYDPEAFFKDPRLHASLGLLLAMWLVYLLGSTNRFAAPVPASRAVTPAAFARAVGGFYARSLDAREAAQAMIARFHIEVRRRLKRPGSGPAWELLERASAIDRNLVQALRGEQARIDAARSDPRRYPRDLRRLAALIRQLRESLQ